MFTGLWSRAFMSSREIKEDNKYFQMSVAHVADAQQKQNGLREYSTNDMPLIYTGGNKQNQINIIIN